MKNLNPIEKRIFKGDQKVLIKNPSKLLRLYFNNVVVQFDEEYIYEP